MSLNDLKFSQKITLCFAGVVIVVLAMCSIIFVEMNASEKVSDANDSHKEALSTADAALTALVEQQNAVRGFVASGEGKFQDTFKARGADFDKAAQALAASASDPDSTAAVDRLKSAAAAAQAEEREQLADRLDPGKLAADQASIATRGRLTAVREALKQFRAPLEAAVAKGAKEEQAAFDESRLALEMGAGAVAVLSVLMGWLLNRVTARPIVQLTGVMGRLAANDLETEVLGLQRRDEVGEMARAVQVFKDNGLALTQAEAEKLRLESASAAERRQTEEAKAAAAREQAFVVDSIGAGLAKLSAGDLTFRLTEAFPGEYSKLQDDFNGAIGKLHEAMGVISSNAEGITSGAGEISQAADDLSKRTEQQAATLEETAAALDEITATVKRTAEGAGQANTVVAGARSDAERSGEVVRQTVAAMNGIETSARQISQIIGVIDEIAFQTNLLALNAGVEAARAGDAGKGFAVVASEVRALAQRSAEAAKEIKSLISTSSQQVGAGVELVGQAGEALDRIVGHVSEISTLVAEIAASAQEQATGLSQVNTAVNQMDQTTQQNAAMVEQSTAASHSLAQEAHQLSGLVSKFQIGGSPARAAASVPASHKASHRPSPAAAFASRHSAPALKTVRSAAQPDSWEEF